MRQSFLLYVLVILIVLTTFVPWILVIRDESTKTNVEVFQLLQRDQPQQIDREQQVGSNETEPKTLFHFIVSSGCSRYQWWQVFTQIHSAKSVGQRGRYTWIVSGCPDRKDPVTAEQLAKVFETHFPSSSPQRDGMQVSRVHFTPDYSNMSVYGGPYADGTKKRTFLNRKGQIQKSNYGNHYHFNNKPNGLRHWAEEHEADLMKKSSNEAIVLIDPDFLFVAPFELPEQVSPGQPVAASYGLGAQWLDFNVSAICGENSPCTRVTQKDVRHHYSVGPPYIIHANDVLRLATLWSNYVPPTFDQYPLLYAEMFAYSMAAAHLELKHKLLNGLFTGCMVGWPGPKKVGSAGPSAKAFAESGSDAKVPVWDGPSSCFLAPLKPPPLLHYCRRYAFAIPGVNGSYYYMAKRRVPTDILDCDNPTKFLTPFQSNERERISGGEHDWTTLTACSIVRAVNYARKRHCDEARYFNQVE